MAHPVEEESEVELSSALKTGKQNKTNTIRTSRLSPYEATRMILCTAAEEVSGNTCVKSLPYLDDAQRFHYLRNMRLPTNSSRSTETAVFISLLF